MWTKNSLHNRDHRKITIKVYHGTAGMFILYKDTLLIGDNIIGKKKEWERPWQKKIHQNISVSHQNNHTKRRADIKIERKITLHKCLIQKDDMKVKLWK